MTGVKCLAAFALTLAVGFPAFAAGDASRADCVACAGKSLSPYRSQVYLEKARSAANLQDAALWLSIALRFDPENAAAERLLSDLLEAGEAAPGATISE